MLLISRSTATSAFASAVAIVAGVMNYVLTEHGIGIMTFAVATLATARTITVSIVMHAGPGAVLAYRAASATVCG